MAGDQVLGGIVSAFSYSVEIHAIGILGRLDTNSAVPTVVVPRHSDVEVMDHGPILTMANGLGCSSATVATGGSDGLSTVGRFVEANRRGAVLYNAIEVLLKGPEINLPEHDMVAYWDHEADKERKKARIGWWDHDAPTLPAWPNFGIRN